MKKKTRVQVTDVKSSLAQSDKVCINRMISLRGIDPHPNKEGHAVIATQVIQDLEKSGFFDKIKE